MAATRLQTTQLFSHQFVNCAGSVLFRLGSRGHLQICFLHHLTKNEYLLPKGRQDRGESLAQAALRETYEETGYKCELLPVDMLTRATEPGLDTKDMPVLVKKCSEPFTVSLRHAGENDIKFIWWFITIVPEADNEKNTGTQMRSENFEAILCDVDVDMGDDTSLDRAVDKLTYANDRNIAKTALKLVGKTYSHWFPRVICHEW